MKRFLIAMVTITCAATAFAGITYDFTTTSSGMSATQMNGTVHSDAGKRRIAVVTGDDTLFPAGSVILASGTALTVFDPAKKTYYDFDINKYVQQALTGAGGARLDFANPKVSVHDDGTETIAGYPARRQTIDNSFDVTPNIAGLGQQMKMAVHSTTEIWTTDKLPADAGDLLQTARMHTGVAAIDKVIDAMHIDGFPLKQVTTTSVSMNGGDPITSTSTTTISNIRTDVKIDPSEFVLPAGLTKVDDPVERMLKKSGLD